ncbi:hypothetical protein TRVA0_001S01244 [Trichomonascus vanleenenianus]|uniref:uncharacterized protein n=1 Tax=Trichomonascus vanleenenianus TaxID=2268995 RepID=UPI003EC9F6F4
MAKRRTLQESNITLTSAEPGPKKLKGGAASMPELLSFDSLENKAGSSRSVDGSVEGVYNEFLTDHSPTETELLDDIKRIGRGACELSNKSEVEKWHEEGQAAILRYALLSDDKCPYELVQRALQASNILANESAHALYAPNRSPGVEKAAYLIDKYQSHAPIPVVMYGKEKELFDDLKRMGRAVCAVSSEHEFEKWREESQAAIVRYAQFPDEDEYEVVERALQACDIFSEETAHAMAESNRPEAIEKYLDRFNQAKNRGMPETTAVLDKSKGKRRANGMDSASTDAANETGNTRPDSDSVEGESDEPSENEPGNSRPNSVKGSLLFPSTDHSHTQTELLDDIKRIGRAACAVSSKREFEKWHDESLAAIVRYAKATDEHESLHEVGRKTLRASSILAEESAHALFKPNRPARADKAAYMIDKYHNRNFNQVVNDREEKVLLDDIKRMGHAVCSVSSERKYEKWSEESVDALVRYAKFFVSLEDEYEAVRRVLKACYIFSEEAAHAMVEFNRPEAIERYLDRLIQDINCDIPKTDAVLDKRKGKRKVNDSTSTENEPANSVHDSIEGEYNESGTNSRYEKELLDDMERFGRAIRTASNEQEGEKLCHEAVARLARYREFCNEHEYPFGPTNLRAQDMFLNGMFDFRVKELRGQQQRTSTRATPEAVDINRRPGYVRRVRRKC